MRETEAAKAQRVLASHGERILAADASIRSGHESASGSAPAPVAESGTVAAVDLLYLLSAADDALLVVNGRWYLAERDPRYLRRNALVALGNVGDGRDPATAAVLARWTHSEDALLAEHARWAAGRLGRHDLVPTPGPGSTGPVR